MEIIFSEEFKKEYSKIKDKKVRLRITKQIIKISENPGAGKPLKYEFKDYRSLRIPPFRLIYKIEKNKIVINFFEHRKDAYN